MLLTWLLPFLFLAHPLHISQTDVAWTTKKQSVQITLRIFIDDLEESLRKSGHDKLFIGTERENKAANTHLQAYLKQHVQLKINGKPAQWQWIGKEPTEDLQAIWCYIEVPKVTKLQSLTLTNTLLTELYSDQQNMVELHIEGQKTTYATLDERNTSVTLGK